MIEQLLQSIVLEKSGNSLLVIECDRNKIRDCLAEFSNFGIDVLNLGYEVAVFLEELLDYSYLSIEAYDFTKKLLNKNIQKAINSDKDALVIYNLGILFEPALEIKVSLLLKEYLKTASIILIWETSSESVDNTNWLNQQNNIFFEFAESQIKKLQYAI